MQSQHTGHGTLKPRRAERSAVRATASLRRSGYNKVPVNLLDLSATGFRIETFCGLAVGSPVWVTLVGLAPLEATVVWTRGDHAGCEFRIPLHPAVMDSVIRRV